MTSGLPAQSYPCDSSSNDQCPTCANYFQDDGYSTDTSSDDGARSLPELTILLKPICSMCLPARSGVMFQISSPEDTGRVSRVARAFGPMQMHM